MKLCLGMINVLRHTSWLLLCIVFLTVHSFAQTDAEFPAKPNPPKLVNDLAKCMSNEEVAALEEKLVNFDKTTSTQIAIVTVNSIGIYDVQQYAVELANRWGIGRASKDNGVLILAAIKDRKINISTGYGLEGALTDIVSGRIIRNEIVPSFKQQKYFEGFDKATNAIIKATKGEYKATPDTPSNTINFGVILFALIVIIVLLIIIGKTGGGNGGGGYMSGRGYRDFGGGFLGGALLGSGWPSSRGGGGSSWGGGSSGGFGGFGGGGFGGGGASGSW